MTCVEYDGSVDFSDAHRSASPMQWPRAARAARCPTARRHTLKMTAPYEGPLRLCDVESAAQLLSAEWPKQSAESRAKLLRASLDEALPQHVVVVESGAVVARDRVLRST